MIARLLLTAGLSCLAISFLSAQLTEPDTVFFGRVLHHGGGEPHTLTSGNITWRIIPPGGGEIFTVKSSIEPLRNGQLLYHVRIPRNIAVTGIPHYSVPAGLPVLAETTRRYNHADITVNGYTARLADPAALSFSADGATRADFTRMDLIVDFPLPDTDRDGLPDWWESQYGLSVENTNAGVDTDGDGVNDLAEYRAGTDPSLAGTAPQLAAENALALPKLGRAALLLQARDSDSPPELLRYTLLTQPGNVSLSIRDGQADGRSDRPVLAGGFFTQAEINAGRVIFTAIGQLSDATATLSLVDEMPGRVPVITSLRFSTVLTSDLLAATNLRDIGTTASMILHFGASSATALALRSPSGPSALDDPLSNASYVQTWTPQHGPDEKRLFIGSPLNDTLLGSGEADVLVAGGGANILRGYAGADRFVFNSVNMQDTILDFSAADGDVLDLSGLLIPAGGRTLATYLSLQPGPVLRIDADGDGSGFTDGVITLTDSSIPQNLDEAWDAGLIDSGDIAPQTTLFVSATSAAEEALAPGTVSFRRRGDTTLGLTVPISITGTATPGTDYVPLPSSVTFAPGVKTATLSIIPLADDLREPLETIGISLQPHSGYVLGTASASSSIADLPSRVWVEIIERTAYKDSLSPAQILLRRSGTLSTPLTALIQVSGSATAGVDYRRLASSFVFTAGQDVIPVDIAPFSTASLKNGCEELMVMLKADVSYLFGASSSARVVICTSPQTFAAWRDARLPGNPMDDEELLNSDIDGDGFNELMEFALNLNPNAQDSSDKTHTKLIMDENGMPGLEFRRRPGAPEIISEVCQSTDLQNWTPLGFGSSEERSAVIEADGLERVRQFLKEKPAAGRVYLRLRISRQ